MSPVPGSMCEERPPLVMMPGTIFGPVVVEREPKLCAGYVQDYERRRWQSGWVEKKEGKHE